MVQFFFYHPITLEIEPCPLVMYIFEFLAGQASCQTTKDHMIVKRFKQRRIKYKLILS